MVLGGHDGFKWTVEQETLYRRFHLRPDVTSLSQQTAQKEEDAKEEQLDVQVSDSDEMIEKILFGDNVISSALTSELLEPRAEKIALGLLGENIITVGLEVNGEVLPNGMQAVLFASGSLCTPIEQIRSPHEQNRSESSSNSSNSSSAPSGSSINNQDSNAYRPVAQNQPQFGNNNHSRLPWSDNHLQRGQAPIYNAPHYGDHSMQADSRPEMYMGHYAPPIYYETVPAPSGIPDYYQYGNNTINSPSNNHQQNPQDNYYNQYEQQNSMLDSRPGSFDDY